MFASLRVLQWSQEMSQKIKALLVVLLLGVGVAFWYWSGVFSPIETASIANQINTPNSPNNCSADEDHDGLSNCEETYWNTDFKNPDTDGDGFKDGEEVLTGHDPAKKGPDDFLDDRRNLTLKTSQLLLGGIVAGDLSPTSKNYQDSLDRLVSQIFDQYTTNTTAEGDSVVLAGSDKKSLATYGLIIGDVLRRSSADMRAGYTAFIETIRGVLLSDLPKLSRDNPSRFSAYSAAADRQIASLDSFIADAKAIKVPPQMKPFHLSFLTFLRGAQQQYRSAKAIGTDPLQGMIALQMLRTLISETSTRLTGSFMSLLSQASQ